MIEMMLFGALPKCHVCKEGDLSFSFTNNRYKCHGYSSAWAKVKSVPLACRASSCYKQNNNVLLLPVG